MVLQKFIVSNMHCSSCAMHLEELEDELPGVLEVKASYQKQEMWVKYDETRVTAAQITNAAMELGYEAVISP